MTLYLYQQTEQMNITDLIDLSNPLHILVGVVIGGAAIMALTKVIWKVMKALSNFMIFGAVVGMIFYGLTLLPDPGPAFTAPEPSVPAFIMVDGNVVENPAYKTGE